DLSDPKIIAMINDAFTVDPPLIVAWRLSGGGRFCVEQTTDAVHHCHPDRLRGSLATKEEWENVPSVVGFPKGVAQTVVAVATVCCSPPRERWECVGFKMRSPERRPRHARFSRGGVREGRHTWHIRSRKTICTLYSAPR